MVWGPARYASLAGKPEFLYPEGPRVARGSEPAGPPGGVISPLDHYVFNANLHKAQQFAWHPYVKRKCNLRLPMPKFEPTSGASYGVRT